jgi:indolepyruvate ferredoxin oxidoreductase
VLESGWSGSTPDALPLTRAVARSLHKLMAIKDEYEVARLYTDGVFQQALKAQFEGGVRLQLHLAPPPLSRPQAGQAPRKFTFEGRWLLPLMKLLAHGRRLRGSALDLFGRTHERRLERDLITAFEARLDELMADLAEAPPPTPERRALALEITRVPLAMRGYGHVKLAQVALARAREAELLHRWNPRRHPRPAATAQAGQIRGIRVTAG